MITACAVATSSCISDVPSQWEGQNFDLHCSHIFQSILMKLNTKKDIWDTTVDFDGPSLDLLCLRRSAHEGIKKQYPVKVVVLPLLASLSSRWLQIL